jgi:hypothetical protein
MDRRPILQDAMRRAPCVVHRSDGTATPGRVWSVGGDRRTPNGRCRVLLASGAWLTPRISDVEVTG